MVTLCLFEWNIFSWGLKLFSSCEAHCCDFFDQLPFVGCRADLRQVTITAFLTLIKLHWLMCSALGSAEHIPYSFRVFIALKDRRAFSRTEDWKLTRRETASGFTPTSSGDLPARSIRAPICVAHLASGLCPSSFCSPTAVAQGAGSGRIPSSVSVLPPRQC